jgi:hypothetical protein
MTLEDLHLRELGFPVTPAVRPETITLAAVAEPRDDDSSFHRWPKCAHAPGWMTERGDAALRSCPSHRQREATKMFWRYHQQTLSSLQISQRN